MHEFTPFALPGYNLIDWDTLLTNRCVKRVIHLLHASVETSVAAGLRCGGRDDRDWRIPRGPDGVRPGDDRFLGDEVAFPRLRANDIKYQVEFTIRPGHARITAKGRESWIRRGRADILLTMHGKPLAIMEPKRRDVPLTPEDGEQGLSYARLLPDTMTPFVVVTNGGETRILETFTGRAYQGGSPDAKAFEALVASAAKLAARDRDAAVATLMGNEPQVWTNAVRIASTRVRTCLRHRPSK